MHVQVYFIFRKWTGLLLQFSSAPSHSLYHCQTLFSKTGKFKHTKILWESKAQLVLCTCTALSLHRQSLQLTHPDPEVLQGSLVNHTPQPCILWFPGSQSLLVVNQIGCHCHYHHFLFRSLFHLEYLEPL